MEVSNNSPAIYNPAAVVETSNRGSSGRQGAVSRTEDDGGDNLTREGLPNKQISQVSRARAANGEANFSEETLKAIQNGAIPPVVYEPKSEPMREISELGQQLASTGGVNREVTADSGLPEIAAGAGARLPAGSVVNIVV